MQSVFMKFDKDGAGVWHVTLIRDSRDVGRARQYSDFRTVWGLAERGRALKSLADKQATEVAERMGRGGCTILLTAQELEKL